MKKRWSGIAVIVMVAAGLFAAQPASAATGDWRSYPGSFTVPSNWHCGPSSHGPKLSAQSCIVRSGNYVQVATIVRNRTTSLAISNVHQTMWNGNGVVRSSGTCGSSGIAAQTVAVCFTSTVTSAGQVASRADVWDPAGASLIVDSPWA
jgi:hypothetical protein